MYAARWASTAGVSAQASLVTNGRRRCRSASEAWSFSCIASLQIGREKHSGMSSTRRTGWYANPAATIAASLMLLAGKRMRAELELPIQDMIEAVHGDHPLGTPPAQTASLGRRLSMVRKTRPAGVRLCLL